MMNFNLSIPLGYCRRMNMPKTASDYMVLIPPKDAPKYNMSQFIHETLFGQANDGGDLLLYSLDSMVVNTYVAMPVAIEAYANASAATGDPSLVDYVQKHGSELAECAPFKTYMSILNTIQFTILQGGEGMILMSMREACIADQYFSGMSMLDAVTPHGEWVERIKKAEAGELTLYDVRSQYKWLTNTMVHDYFANVDNSPYEKALADYENLVKKIISEDQ